MKIFIYNTLLNHPTLAHALRYLPRTRKAKMANVSEKSYNGYPTLVPSPGHRVYGEVFEIGDTEVKRLDKWEEKYHRVLLRLMDGELAYAYVLKKNE